MALKWSQTLIIATFLFWHGNIQILDLQDQYLKPVKDNAKSSLHKVINIHEPSRHHFVRETAQISVFSNCPDDFLKQSDALSLIADLAILGKTEDNVKHCWDLFWNIWGDTCEIEPFSLEKNRTKSSSLKMKNISAIKIKIIHHDYSNDFF